MAETIISKRCSKCKQFKPLSEFYKHSSTKDGFRPDCKVCHTIQTIYATKKHQKTEKFRITQKQYLQTEQGKATQRLGQGRYNKRHPEKIKAYNAINNAINSGKLPRPDTLQCHYGSHPAQQYHHWKGYEPQYWLDVVPACRLCDIQQHRNN